MSLVSSGPSPENLLDEQIELLPPPFADVLPPNITFGDVQEDLEEGSYKSGMTAKVVFYGANPRHDVKVFITKY